MPAPLVATSAATIVALSRSSSGMHGVSCRVPARWSIARNWAFVGVAVLLVVGAVLDGTAHRDWSGRPTLGQERIAETIEEGIPLDRGTITLIAASSRSAALEDRYGLYHALRRHTPNADVIVVEPTSNISSLYILALGQADSVRRLSLITPRRYSNNFLVQCFAVSFAARICLST